MTFGLSLGMGVGSPGRDGGVTVLDALNGVLPSNVTFTRASGGTYFGSDGLLKTAGTDVARFDYNPATLAPRGLLVEAQRTNLLLWNRDLTNAAWTKSNMTVAKTATGLDGAANSASRLTATSNNGTVLQAITSGSAARATTAYVRRVSGTGTVEMTQNGGTNWTAITLTSSWQRFGPATAAVTNPSVGFRIGTSGDAIDVDYVQLESASFASSAILTTTASATRAGDNASVLNLSTIGYNPNEGTIIVEAEAPRGSSSWSRVMALGSDNNNYMAMQRNGVDYRATIVVAGVTVFNPLFAGWSNGTVAKLALAYKNNDVGACMNGGTVSTDAVAIPVVTAMGIGCAPSGGGQFFGHIRRLVYYPVRLSNGQLQALTQ